MTTGRINQVSRRFFSQKGKEKRVSLSLFGTRNVYNKRCCLDTFFVTFQSQYIHSFFFPSMRVRKEKTTKVIEDRTNQTCFYCMAQLTFPRLKWGEVESLAASLFIAHKILFRKHIGCETQNCIFTKLRKAYQCVQLICTARSNQKLIKNNEVFDLQKDRPEHSCVH